MVWVIHHLYTFVVGIKQGAPCGQLRDFGSWQEKRLASEEGLDEKLINCVQIV
jgi:hypothetical protein